MHMYDVWKVDEMIETIIAKQICWQAHGQMWKF